MAIAELEVKVKSITREQGDVIAGTRGLSGC